MQDITNTNNAIANDCTNPVRVLAETTHWSDEFYARNPHWVVRSCYSIATRDVLSFILGSSQSLVIDVKQRNPYVVGWPHRIKLGDYRLLPEDAVITEIARNDKMVFVIQVGKPKRQTPLNNRIAILRQKDLEKTNTAGFVHPFVPTCGTRCYLKERPNPYDLIYISYLGSDYVEGEVIPYEWVDKFYNNELSS